MTGPRFLVWLPINALLLAACGESTTPTQPEAAGTDVASAAAVASNTWAPRKPIPAPISGFAVGAAPNAAGEWVVQTFGGMDEVGTGFGGWSYHVATDTWSGNGALVRSADLNGVGKIGNRLYFTGGESCCDEFFRTWNTTWAYEPATRRLLQKANTPKATKYGVSGAIGGKLYVLPGYCSGESVDPGHCAVGQFTRQLYRYDPATDTWITRRQAPHNHALGGAAVIGDKFYVVGGSDRNAHLDVYDPTTNAWRTRAPIPTPGDRLFAAPLLSKLFVLSWSFPSGGPAVAKAFLYDPATDKWTPRAAPPVRAGPIVNVKLDGQPHLFMAGMQSSFLYTP